MRALARAHEKLRRPRRTARRQPRRCSPASPLCLTLGACAA